MLTGSLSSYCLLLLLVVVADSPAQQEFYHPELEWKTIETEHFFVHYHEGAERTGRVVAAIAEEIYEPVTSLYDHKPDQKVSFIIKDYDDISNGAAYFYDNKIEIYAPSMDFVFRGTHNWLRNVVTHEFTHVVQIQTAMKFGRRVPGVYLQWLGYESERRPDVLYGFPNVVVSYPISGFVLPAWFAEGVAQYNRAELRYDFWDTHRDMILRSYVLDGNMLSWEEMGVFGKNSLGNESSYNAGFAFVHYLAQRYGEVALADVSRNLSTLMETTIDGAIERTTGKRGRQIYDEWKEELSRSYTARVAPIRSDLREGIPIPFVDEGDGVVGSSNVSLSRNSLHMDLLPHAGEIHPCCRLLAEMGFANLYARFSPDGKKFTFVSTGKGDYFSQSSLYVTDLQTRKARPVQRGVASGMSWSPDNKKLYYSRSSHKNPHWSFVHDIYVYDLEKDEEARLTFGKRAISPAVSPDGSRIAFVVNSDGTTNLAMTKVDGSDFKLITSYENREQVYDPQWSPDGEHILFDYSIKDGRDLAWIRPDGSGPQFLITGPDDSRSGVFTRDGKRVIFSSDRTGIYNLYSYDLSTGRIEQITNVLGGAFLPTVNAQDEIIYSAYTSAGYKLYEIKRSEPVLPGDHDYLRIAGVGETSRGGPLAMATNSMSTSFDWPSLRSYDDTRLPEKEARPYRNIFTSLTMVPFLRVDNYNTHNSVADAIKLGVYLFSNDVLEKTGFFAGASLNKRFERDLFLQFNYRGRIPVFYQLGLEPVASVELYNVTRKTGNFFSLPDREKPIPVDVTYNLLEFDFALNQPIISQIGNLEFRFAHSRYTSILENFVLEYDDSPALLVPGSSDLYLIANDLSLTFRYEGVVRSTTADINPVGRKIALRIGRELNKFNPQGELNTEFRPVYQRVNFTRVELKWKEHIRSIIKSHTLTASLRAGSILEYSVDDFFDFYAGGLIGMRGYPFYAIGGNEIATFGLEYRFPLVHNIDTRFLQFYFDKLYASVYGDVGNAWTGKTPALKDFRKDAGVELRLESFSWYAYPTRVFFNASYGFDRFEKFVRSRDATVTYGKEWRFYLGVLFGFDFD